MQADPTTQTDPSARDAALAPRETAIPEMGMAGASAAPEQRSTEFVAVEGGAETTSAEALLVAAYLVMWGILLVFLLFTWRRQTGLERRLGELERSLDRAEGGPPNRA